MARYEQNTQHTSIFWHRPVSVRGSPLSVPIPWLRYVPHPYSSARNLPKRACREPVVIPKGLFRHYQKFGHSGLSFDFRSIFAMLMNSDKRKAVSSLDSQISFFLQENFIAFAQEYGHDSFPVRRNCWMTPKE
jgi:hypothetical protein